VLNHLSQRSVRAAVAAACCLAAGAASAHYTYEVFDVPGAATAGVGLNDKGEVVGNYVPVGSTNFLGFVRSAGGVITPLSVAGQAQSLPTGIDGSGRIVGTCPTAVCPGMGFVLSPRGALDLGGLSGATMWVPWGVTTLGPKGPSFSRAAVAAHLVASPQPVSCLGRGGTLHALDRPAPEVLRSLSSSS